MNAEQRAEMRRWHIPFDNYPNSCRGCCIGGSADPLDYDYPCDVITLLDALDEAERKIGLARGVAVHYSRVDPAFQRISSILSETKLQVDNG